MLLEDLILHYIGSVFKGYKVKGKSLIRVVRNADIDADAVYDEDLDYREFMADLMKQRKKLSRKLEENMTLRLLKLSKNIRKGFRLPSMTIMLAM